MMMHDEMNICIFKLVWHKAPGNIKAISNGFKVLDDEYRKILCKFISNWLKDLNLEYIEWLLASIKQLPKKGNLKDLNNWRGIILLDVRLKIVSIFINLRL